MGGYSGGDEKPLTLEYLEMQRGEALKNYQRQALVLKEEITKLREESSEILAERKARLAELNESVKQLSEDYTQESKRLKGKKEVLLDDLQGVKDSIQEEINRRDSIVTDFSAREKALDEREDKLNAQVQSLALNSDNITKRVRGMEVEQANILEQNQKLDVKIASFREEQEAKEQVLISSQEYNVKMLAYWENAKREVEALRIENQKLLQGVQEAQARLGIAEEAQLAFEQKQKEVDAKYEQNKVWNENLKQQEADLKLVDKALDNRDRAISQREKLYKQASQGGE